MKISKLNKYFPSVLALACTAPISIQSAQAVSVYNSNAAVTYTINSITNQTTSGSVSGLTITGAFELDALSTSTTFTGDGTASASSSATGPTAISAIVGSSFGETLQSDGSAGIGTADVFYLGLFGLEFDNVSTDTFAIDVQLDYTITATASADEDAASDIFLDFYNDSELFAGGDSVFASAPFAPADSITNSVTYSFLLNGNSFDALYVDASISGNLLSTTPVPVPAAFWLFSTALLGLPGVRKLKAMAV